MIVLSLWVTPIHRQGSQWSCLGYESASVLTDGFRGRLTDPSWAGWIVFPENFKFMLEWYQIGSHSYWITVWENSVALRCWDLRRCLISTFLRFCLLKSLFGFEKGLNNLLINNNLLFVIVFIQIFFYFVCSREFNILWFIGNQREKKKTLINIHNQQHLWNAHWS